MQPTPLYPPLAGCLWAAPACLLARTCLPLGALLAAIGLLAALHRRTARAGLCALPALLAALPAPPEPLPLPRPGPVRVHGQVAAVVREPLHQRTSVQLSQGTAFVWLHIDGPVRLLPGDRVTAIARCSASALPDGARSLMAHTAAVQVHAGTPSLARACAALRRAGEDQLLRHVPGEQGVLLCTLVLGAGTRLPPDIAAAHRATGLSHLLAVSGAHAAMLGWLLGLLPFAGGPRPRQGWTRTVTGLVLLVVYGFVTGGEPPVFRALCAFALVAVGDRCGRRTGVLPAVTVPALASCALFPTAVLGPSFALSYAAVLGLALAGPPRNRTRSERWLWAPLRSSAAATLLTAPLTLFWFGQLAPWTVLLTPILAPLVAALLFGGLALACCGGAVPALAAPLGGCLMGLSQLYASVVTAADALPGTPIHAITTPTPWTLFAVGLVAAAVLLWRRNAQAVVLACTLACLPHFVPPAAPAAPTLVLFAVGHGQCGLLQLPDGRNVVVDCGSQQQPSLPARRLAAALRRRRIDLLVLTHGDHDHTSGVAALLQRVPVATAVVPTAMLDGKVVRQLRAEGTQVLGLQPGERLAPHPAVTIAAPRPDRATTNDGSLWICLDLGGTKVLLTGDAEEAGVQAALEQGIAVPCDVLVLPHHGRRNAMAAELLAATKPRVCCVSAAAGAPPGPQVVMARSRGLPVHDTAAIGDVVVCGGPPATIAGTLPQPIAAPGR